ALTLLSEATAPPVAVSVLLAPAESFTVIVLAAASVETTSAFIDVALAAGAAILASDFLVSAFFEAVCALAAPAAARAITRAIAIFFTMPPQEHLVCAA